MTRTVESILDAVAGYLDAPAPAVAPLTVPAWRWATLSNGRRYAMWHARGSRGLDYAVRGKRPGLAMLDRFEPVDLATDPKFAPISPESVWYVAPAHFW